MKAFIQYWRSAMPYVSIVVILIVSIFFAIHRDRESNKRWCSLLMTINTAYQTQPPTTPTGQILSRDIATLLRDFDCEKDRKEME